MKRINAIPAIGRFLGPPVLTALVAANLSAATCESLKTLVQPNTTITTAESVAGSFRPPQGASIPGLMPICRVAGIIHPVEDSEISFEVWIPSTGWNGKFYGIGNGGFAGSIDYRSLAAAVRRGDAAAATDTGHATPSGEISASWALKHPQKIVDFGYRAIHETAVKGKAIAAAFYGSAVQHAYFNSCSNGGRQALMEAQRYPEDYDGIVAGAPANYWTHLLTESMWDVAALLSQPGSYIPAAKTGAIEKAVLAACDAADGIQDGLVDDPARCHFDPGVMLCQGADTNACLTAAQVATLRKLYAGPGDRIFPGHAPGGEGGLGGWAAWVTGAAPEKSLGFAFGTQFFKNMVYQDANWDYHSFNLAHDLKEADDKMARDLNANDADIKPFVHRGGKLILYHGWSDAGIPPYNTIDYYNRVADKLKEKDTAASVRLYMAPGMQHCGGGPGPNSFDMNKPMEAWVEQGVPPGAIVATSPARSRPLCPYPEVARWKGSESTDHAVNFSCVMPAGDARPAPK